MALLMAGVAAGEGVTEEPRREMLALLLQESIRDGIPSGVPPNSAVAHKSGNFTDATHDVALVWGLGGPYVIAVLSDRSWDSRPIAAGSRAGGPLAGGDRGPALRPVRPPGLASAWRRDDGAGADDPLSEHVRYELRPGVHAPRLAVSHLG